MKRSSNKMDITASVLRKRGGMASEDNNSGSKMAGARSQQRSQKQLAPSHSSFEFNPYQDYSNEELKAVQIYANQSGGGNSNKKIPTLSKTSSVQKIASKEASVPQS